MPWTTQKNKKITKSILEQINTEPLLEAKTTKLKLFRHIIRRQGSLEKTLLLRTIDTAGKKEDQI